MKFVVFSLGCRVNIYEGQAMIKEFVARGHEATDKLEKADCYVLNTCSVTAEADKKSRQAVARALRINPNAKIAVCGCSSQNDPAAYEKKTNVFKITGVGGKMSLVDEILAALEKGETEEETDVKPLPVEYEDDASGEVTKTRGYVKVQDGCNNFCSYCIIPYLRGRSRSRKMESVICEAEEMSEKTNEIVITGVDVSDYRDGENGLAELVRALGKVPVRKRFGSFDCIVVDEKLLTAMKESDFCESFHLSMQSGSDGVLGRMNRHYTSAEFLRVCDLIRSVFPTAGITTDVIAGFPGETEEEFNETVETCRKAKFADMHVFPYSMRKGTVAAKMQQVDGETIRIRAARLRSVADELRTAHLNAKIGTVAEVLFEDEENGLSVGYTRAYEKVYAVAPTGKILNVKITSLYGEGLKGEVL